jgi:hypothetical protein
VTIDEARNEIQSTEIEIQLMLQKLQARIGANIDDVSVTIIKAQSISTPSANSYIGRVKIGFVL